MTIAPFLAPERDDLQKVGRAKASGGTVYYTTPGTSFSSLSTFAFAANTDYYFPIYIATTIVVDQVACEVTTGASGNLRVGLYKASADQQPMGGPLIDSGSIAITVAVKTFTPSAPVYLQRGRYVGVLNMDTSSTLRVVRATGFASPFATALGTTATITTLNVARSYAAFPTPGTAWDTAGTGTGLAILAPIFYRVLAP